MEIGELVILALETMLVSLCMKIKMCIRDRVYIGTK